MKEKYQALFSFRETPFEKPKKQPNDYKEVKTFNIYDSYSKPNQPKKPSTDLHAYIKSKKEIKNIKEFQDILDY